MYWGGPWGQWDHLEVSGDGGVTLGSMGDTGVNGGHGGHLGVSGDSGVTLRSVGMVGSHGGQWGT